MENKIICPIEQYKNRAEYAYSIFEAIRYTAASGGPAEVALEVIRDLAEIGVDGVVVGTGTGDFSKEAVDYMILSMYEHWANSQ